MNDECATPAEAYREMVCNIGMDNADSQWILTPYDTWEKNPAYVGPPQPHPEDDTPSINLNSFAERSKTVEMERGLEAYEEARMDRGTIEDDCPF
jgi:hypothetical protein